MQICSPHATARPSLALNTPALSGCFYSNRHNPCALDSALCTQPCLGSCTCSPFRPAPLSAPCHQPFLQSPCLRPSLHSNSDQHLVSLSQSWCQGHNHCFICTIPSCTPTRTGLGGHRAWFQGGPCGPLTGCGGWHSALCLDPSMSLEERKALWTEQIGRWHSPGPSRASWCFTWVLI